MLVGIIKKDGSLMPTYDVLKEGEETGFVDGYPTIVLRKMLISDHTSQISASQIAGGTWRRTVLERLVDYYASPRSLWPMLRGTIIHEGLQAIVPVSAIERGLMVEKRLRASLPQHRNIILSGQIDIYNPFTHRLEDYKSTSRVPQTIKYEHLFQLAIYAWLLRWNEYEVDSAVINYILWDEIATLDSTLYGNEVIPCVEHPLFTDSDYFQETVKKGYDTLYKGYTPLPSPLYQGLQHNYCRNCSVKSACDRISPNGAQINPKDF
jgi:hypothetical protein